MKSILFISLVTVLGQASDEPNPQENQGRPSAFQPLNSLYLLPASQEVKEPYPTAATSIMDVISDIDESDTETGDVVPSLGVPGAPFSGSDQFGHYSAK